MRDTVFLKRFCCLSLRAGALTVAAIYVMLSVLGTILTIIALSYGWPGYWVILGAALVTLPINSLLVLGILKDSYMVVMTWVFVGLMGVVANGVYFIHDMITLQDKPLYVPILRLLLGALHVMAIKVIHSYAFTMPS